MRKQGVGRHVLSGAHLRPSGVARTPTAVFEAQLLAEKAEGPREGWVWTEIHFLLASKHTCSCSLPSPRLCSFSWGTPHGYLISSQLPLFPWSVSAFQAPSRPGTASLLSTVPASPPSATAPH